MPRGHFMRKNMSQIRINRIFGSNPGAEKPWACGGPKSAKPIQRERTKKEQDGTAADKPIGEPLGEAINKGHPSRVKSPDEQARCHFGFEKQWPKEQHPPILSQVRIGFEGIEQDFSLSDVE